MGTGLGLSFLPVLIYLHNKTIQASLIPLWIKHVNITYLYTAHLWIYRVSTFRKILIFLFHSFQWLRIRFIYVYYERPISNQFQVSKWHHSVCFCFCWHRLHCPPPPPPPPPHTHTHTHTHIHTHLDYAFPNILCSEYLSNLRVVPLHWK